MPLKIGPASDPIYTIPDSQHNRDIADWVVTNAWDSAYYSGLDVSVYFDDIFMDEVIQLQYQVLEKVNPLYGYADYVFRRVIRGSRIVQGTFTINFKEGGYFCKFMETLTQRATKAPKEMETPTSIAAASVVDAMAIKGDLTLEDVMARAGKDFSVAMDALDRAYWGSSISKGSKGVGSNIDKAQLQFRRPLFTTVDQGFDIVVKYGQPDDKDKAGWGTIEKVSACYITGFSKIIDDSGRNVQEAYQFLAATPYL